MAVPEQTPYKEYTANGSTTSFALGFICDSKNDLIVLVDGVEPPIASWSLVGGNAVFTTAPASGKKIILQRNTAMSRTTNYQGNNNSFRPETINKDIDRVWLKLQELGVADMLLKIYVDRLHSEQKDYIDNKDQLVRNIISDLRNYANQQDSFLVQSISSLRNHTDQIHNEQKNYIDRQDNNRNSYFENLISRQGVSLQQLDNYYDYLMQRIAQITVDKGWDTSFVTYQGITQEKINDGLMSVSEMLNIRSPKNGMRVFVKGIQGGWFEYNSSKANLNDAGTVFNGWVRIHFYNNITRLSWFGAKADAPSSANLNETALINAIRCGDVLVDGYYHVSCTSSNTILNSFSLVAEKPKNGLEFTSTFNRWVCIGSVNKVALDGIKLRASPSLAGSIFTTELTTTLINLFDIINCDIDIGRVRLFSSDFSTTVNPVITKYGISKLRILTNEIANPSVLFNGTNMPHELIELKHNRLKNLSVQCFSFGIANEHLFGGNVKAVMKRLECEFNTVISDDDFFAINTGSYLCLVLYEGDYCKYIWNHVEGLKTRNKVAVYDAYLSPRELHYYHNTWKNNLCMNTTKTNADLMKSKGTPISFYKYNKFIVEKSFIERHGANQDGMAWVTLFQKVYGDDSSNMVIHDNEIDVYEFYMQPASNLTRNVDIRRNIFKANRCSSTFLNVNNTAPDISSYADSSIVIQDNEFEIEDAGVTLYRDGASVNGFILFNMVHEANNGKGIPKKLSINNNKIKIKNLHSASFISGSPIASQIDTNNNEWVVENLIVAASMRTLETLSNVGNMVKNSVGNKIFGNFDVRGLNNILSGAKANLYANEINGAYKNWYCHILTPTNNSLFVVVLLEALSSAGKFSATYNFKLTPTGIEYIDSAGTPQALAYPGTTNYTYVSPKIEKINPLDTIMAGIQVGLRDAGNPGGSLRINLSSSSFTDGENVKFKFNVETFVV